MRSQWRTAGFKTHRSVGRERRYREQNLLVGTTQRKGIPSYGSLSSPGAHARWENDSSPGGKCASARSMRCGGIASLCSL